MLAAFPRIWRRSTCKTVCRSCKRWTPSVCKTVQSNKSCWHVSSWNHDLIRLIMNVNMIKKLVHEVKYQTALNLLITFLPYHQNSSTIFRPKLYSSLSIFLVLLSTDTLFLFLSSDIFSLLFIISIYRSSIPYAQPHITNQPYFLQRALDKNNDTYLAYLFDEDELYLFL